MCSQRQLGMHRAVGAQDWGVLSTGSSPDTWSSLALSSSYHFSPKTKLSPAKGQGLFSIFFFFLFCQGPQVAIPCKAEIIPAQTPRHGHCLKNTNRAELLMLHPPNFPVSTPFPRDHPLIPDSTPGSCSECHGTWFSLCNFNTVQQELNSPVTHCLSMSLFTELFPPKTGPDFISC